MNIKKTAIILAIFLTSILFINTKSVKAASGFDVYIDENNDICIVTNDQKKSSSIFYRTVGFTVSRGKYNPSSKTLAKGKDTEYVRFAIDSSKVTTHAYRLSDGTTREENIFRYSFVELREQIQNKSGEWAQEIDDALTRGVPCYIRFDSDMIIMGYPPLAGKHYQNYPAIDGSNPHNIQNALGWAAGAKTGLATHYNRWLPLGQAGGGATPNPEDPNGPPITPIEGEYTDHHVTDPPTPEPGPGVTEGSTMDYSGDYSGAPDFAGGNANLDGYDAGYGIPTTKTVTGFAEASPWHGNLDVWARMVTRQYNIRDLYKWTPVPLKTVKGDNALSTALSELKKAIRKDKNAIRSKLDSVSPVNSSAIHDTALNHVYHNYVRVTWENPYTGKIVKIKTWGTLNPTDPSEGKGINVPESADKTYTPPTKSEILAETPKIQRQVGWRVKWKYKRDIEQGECTDHDHTGELGYDHYEGSTYTEDYPHYSNGERYDIPKNGNPSTYLPVNSSYRYKLDEKKIVKEENAVIRCVDYKLTCIVNREYWDDNYSDNDGYIQTYAAFEYLDPYKSNFYDLDSVTLYNDIYESYGLSYEDENGEYVTIAGDSIVFDKAIDTYMDVGKADIKNKTLLDYEAWIQDPERTAISSAMIATSDYITMPEFKSRKYDNTVKDNASIVNKINRQGTDYVHKTWDDDAITVESDDVETPIDNDDDDPTELIDDDPTELIDDDPTELIDDNPTELIDDDSEVIIADTSGELIEDVVTPAEELIEDDVVTPLSDEDDAIDTSGANVSSGTSVSDKFTKYSTAITAIEQYINDNTKSMNDYLQVKNPVDKGPATGIYLGNKNSKWDKNDRNASAGVVTGCDFRDAKWIYPSSNDQDSLGKIPELRGVNNVLTEDGVTLNGSVDKSKYWYLCKHSAGANVDIANAYVTDNERKLKDKNKGWEKLGYKTCDINAEAANGAHETDIAARYEHEIVGLVNTAMTPASATLQYDSVLGDHLYRLNSDTTPQDHGESKWGKCMATDEGKMHSDFNSSTGFEPVTIIDKPTTKDNVNPNHPTNSSFIVDPVQIHTPVMSPGIIEDEHGGVSEDNGGNPVTQLINPDTETSTNEMRLDQYYCIKWQDLDDIGQTHRDAPTAGLTPEHAGGFWEETDDDTTEYLEEDEFTKNKYVKFPFEVYYDGRFYAANQWIKIKKPSNFKDASNKMVQPDGSITSDNHWLYTPFYIPTWAKEGLYKDIDFGSRTSATDLDTCIQLKVDAINVTRGTRNSYDQIEAIANAYYNISSSTYDDGAAYVAIYNIPAELSGWIYGFTITGVSDKDVFGRLKNYQSDEEIATTKVTQDYDYSFTANKQDKKSGLKNRFGRPVLRYLFDGTIGYKNDDPDVSSPLVKFGKNKVDESGTPYEDTAQWQEKNTIALVGAWTQKHAVPGDTSSPSVLHYGKSNYLPYMGALAKGSTFSFTLRTISNMWNLNNKDSIKITPTFTYQKYSKDDNKWNILHNDELKVYYSTDNKTFIPYGSSADLSTVQETKMSSPQFEGSYYSDDMAVINGFDYKRYGSWLDYTTYMYNKGHGINDEAMDYDTYKASVDTDATALGDCAITPQAWLKRAVKSYCMSTIILPEELRLFSGEPEDLKINNCTDEGAEVTDPGFSTYRTISDGTEVSVTYDASNNPQYSAVLPTLTYKRIGLDPNNAFGGATYGVEETVTDSVTMDDKFRVSMQSWYGQYFVPSDLFVVDLKAHPEFRDFDDPASPLHDAYVANGKKGVYGDQIYTELHSTYAMDAADASDHVLYKDFMEYYASRDYRDKDGLTKTEDIFLPDGLLNINFKIVAVKDGVPHLIYKGNYCDEWAVEGYQSIPGDLPTLKDPSYPGNIDKPEPGKTEEGVPTQNGDVVVVNLSQKFSDRFRAGIFNIN